MVVGLSVSCLSQARILEKAVDGNSFGPLCESYRNE